MVSSTIWSAVWISGVLYQMYHTSDKGVNGWSQSQLGMQHIPANCWIHVEVLLQQVSIDREWLLHQQRPRGPSQGRQVWAPNFLVLWHTRFSPHRDSACGFKFTEHGLAEKLMLRRSSAEGAFSLILIYVLVCHGMLEQLHCWFTVNKLTLCSC